MVSQYPIAFAREVYVLYPILFTIYMDDLVDDLSGLGVGRTLLGLSFCWWDVLC